MPYSLFAIYEGPESEAPDLASRFRKAIRACPKSLADVLAVDLFLPESEPVVLFDDGPAPAAILQFTAPEREVLEAVAADVWFQQSFLEMPSGVQSCSFRAFLLQPSPVSGEEGSGPRIAGLSFVVRYYGPMPDEQAFVDFYTANHPPILGRLPKIRNVRCYLPEADLSLSDLPSADMRFINEVVFDNIHDLNAALTSDVVADLRTDSARFPAYGHSTHHAMRRESLTAPPVE